MRAIVELEVIGSKKKAKVEALIDTGFTGYVCIPVKVARDLGLELCGEEEYELANGQWITQFLFKGQVRFLGKTLDVQLSLTNSEMAQVGVLLLADCRLTIDFPSERVKVSRRKM
jgi:clan AA aspartic protease